MPLLTELQGDIITILFIIFWGIVIETKFVSRHTIWFNVVPLVILLSSVDMDDLLIYSLIGYTTGSILLSMIPKNQDIKQLVGAKGYGSLTASILILQQQNGEQVFTWLTLILWIGIAIPTYILWWKYKKYNENRRR